MINFSFKRFVWSACVQPLLLASSLLSVASSADIFDDFGYTELSAALGSAMPDGAGIAVLQVEAGDDFTPDESDAEFVGKTFQDLSNTPSTSPSSHATGVGRNFYGLTSSMAPAVTDIGIFGANPFIFEFLQYDISSLPGQSHRRIANHSWVGNFLTNSEGESLPLATSNFLRRLEWVIARDEFIHVAAPNNGSVGPRPLLTTVFNAITAGRTDANHLKTVADIDTIYVAGRPAIHLVSPQPVASRAAPDIASAVVLMVDAAHANPAWSDGNTSNRAGDVIYNAERSETIKAALMAGASRFTNNTASAANVDDYRVATVDQTANGLDWRYGAGQLNINNSYAILAAGEQTSIQEGGNAILSYTGFDYMPKFGGRRNADTLAEYNLGTSTGNQFFAVSLVWNLDVEGVNNGFFDSSAVLRNLDLYLVDTTAGANTVVASSLSTIDNTENIWFELLAGHDYQIRVESVGADFEWDYSLAWHAIDFLDTDADGVFDHLDSDSLDACVPTVFVSVCATDSDNDGLTDFDEGELTDSDGDGILDYLESNLLDSDADGVFDYLESNILDDDGDGFTNHLDVWNDDACRPDASQCTYDIPMFSAFAQWVLAAGLLCLGRRGLRVF